MKPVMKERIILQIIRGLQILMSGIEIIITLASGQLQVMSTLLLRLGIGIRQSVLQSNV